MISFKARMVGLLFLVSANTIVAEFSCPVPSNFQNLKCSGSVTAKSMSDVVLYKNGLGIKNGKPKNLILDLDLNTNALTIVTPVKLLLRKEDLSTSVMTYV